MSDKIKVFALGGLDEDGKNMYIVEINDDIFVLDCGLKYPNKTIPGVDALIPNFDYLKENKSRVKAYIISHGHDDEIGALPYIYKEVPATIVTSPFTAKVISLYTERIGFKIKYKFDYINGNGVKEIAKRKFYFTQVSHSIPFTYACRILTDQGSIVYSSDLVVDFNNLPDEYRFTSDALNKMPGEDILLLLMDATNAHLSEHTSPRFMITPYIHKVFENSPGKIFIALYGQNFMNLTEILNLAEKTNKTVIFAKKQAQEIYSSLSNDYGLSKWHPHLKFDILDNISRVREKDTLVILINEGSTLFNQIISFVNGEFSTKKIDFNENDIFILDCPAVATNEILATEALDEVYKTGCQVISLSRKELLSMHSSEEDIKAVLSFIKPKYFMPISASFSNLMACAKIALNLDKQYNYSNIFVLDNGMVINIDNGIAKVDYKNLIPTGNVMIDGTDIGNIGNNVIEERNRLSNDGIVIMGITVSSLKKEIIAGPDVQMRGFVFLKDSENILRNVTELFVDQVKISLLGYEDEKTPEEKIIERVTRYLRKETGKNPVIIPAIIDIDK